MALGVCLWAGVPPLRIVQSSLGAINGARVNITAAADALRAASTVWQIAFGFLFIAVVTIVEWPFANFLLSKASENRFFGTIYFDYNSRPEGFDRLRHFFHPDHGAILYFGLLRAAIYASISAWIGLSFGRWMRSVQR